VARKCDKLNRIMINKPKIYLARHGQDEDNALGILNGQRDMPLTLLGIEQAKILSERIKDFDLHIKKVYSSPLKRAYKTAEAITSVLGIEKPEKLDLLIERDFGVMTGRPQKDIEELCSLNILKANNMIYFLAVEGSETFPALLNRAEKILNFIFETCHDKNILLVAHGDIGKMIYAKFYELEWRDVLSDFHFGNSEVLLLEKGIRREDRYIYKTTQHNH
jgi:uncharacterized phosphatase